MPRLALTPRVFFLFVLCVLFVNLIFQSVYFIWVGDKSVRFVDRELAREEKRLLAVIQLSESRNASRSEMQDELARFISLSGMKGYVEINRDNRPLYTSPNLEPGTSFHSIGKSDASRGSITTSIQSVPVRIYSKSEGPYTFVLGLPLNDNTDLQRSIHPYLSLSISVVLFLLAVAGLLLIYFIHKPVRWLERYVESLADHPKILPSLQLPGEMNVNVNILAKNIQRTVGELHQSRDQALEFSSMASHELRTPLSIIRNQLETALSSKLPATQLRSVVGSVYDEMLRLNGIVDDLLSLSTMQAGSFRLNLDTFTVDHFLKQFYDEALFLTRPNNITVVLKKGPQVLVQADHSRLRQVFFNLLDNSIKNTGNGGRIRISYELSGNDILITFADTGRGIPQETVGKIFTPFFKGDGANTGPRGAGLGLALVKWIVESHHGKVSVESQLGKGTTFFIRIPKYQSTYVTLPPSALPYPVAIASTIFQIVTSDTAFPPHNCFFAGVRDIEVSMYSSDGQ